MEREAGQVREALDAAEKPTTRVKYLIPHLAITNNSRDAQRASVHILQRIESEQAKTSEVECKLDAARKVIRELLEYIDEAELCESSDERVRAAELILEYSYPPETYQIIDEVRRDAHKRSTELAQRHGIPIK